MIYKAPGGTWKKYIPRSPATLQVCRIFFFSFHYFFFFARVSSRTLYLTLTHVKHTICCHFTQNAALLNLNGYSFLLHSVFKLKYTVHINAFHLLYILLYPKQLTSCIRYWIMDRPARVKNMSSTRLFHVVITHA